MAEMKNPLPSQAAGNITINLYKQNIYEKTLLSMQR